MIDEDKLMDMADEARLDAIHDAGLVYDGRNWVEPPDDPEYEAWQTAELERHERECGCPWTGGPAHDPYSTACTLDKGHDGDHEGPDPFGNGGTISWDRKRGARELLRRYE